MDGKASDYEVFLSFRGPDTRQGFSDVLYDYMDRVGIRVFRDDDELAIGDKIETILQAINTAQICVPIFSETFASSKWCLREVRRMVELKKVAVPVFYKVTPDDVKLKTQAYRKFLEDHETKYEKNKVQKWEDSLKAITEFKGREVLQTRYTEFCKKFVEEILIKLKPRKRYVLDNLVGLTDLVDRAMKLLDVGSGGVRYICIHGMSGIGKTTLAKVIFNELSTSFDRCSFLENIRESSTRHGLECMQKQLQDSLDPSYKLASNLSSWDIKERFQGKKVLIILDDVDEWEQIEKLAGKSSWFGPGSRVIVTTRKTDVLKEYGKIEEDSVREMEMSTLNDDKAIQLFSRYAFDEDSPPAVFQSLSHEAVSTAGGLPLALVVIGSLLRKRDEKVWRDVIARSKRIPPKEVKNRLHISYNALEDDQKHIFLDIACFFIGSRVSVASYMWEACDLYPIYGLAVLSSMSLVKITDKGEIWMHDQLRDLGRDIVREESIADPRRRSRLWVQQEALKVLMCKEGKQMVEGLSLHKPLNNTLTHEHLAGFDNIRFLKLADANIEGDFANGLGKLTWFSWHLCPSHFNATNFYSENLVILDLSHSFICENWGGWSLIQMAENLKVLDLRSCHNLTTTPDFSYNVSLERLVLSGCSKLEKLDGSIGKLTSLKYLDLQDCYSLHGLPEEIGSLKQLEEIFASGHFGTFSLPESIGNLRSLVSFKLEEFRVMEIPSSIGGLERLNHLSIYGCHGLSKIPESLGNLESLVELNLSDFATLSELPDSIGNLVKLKKLDLSGCSEIKELPNTLGELESLVQINVSRWKIKRLPRSIGRMRNLEELFAFGCNGLTEIPTEIGELSRLRRLHLNGTSISVLPSTVNQLTCLRILRLENNNLLRDLPELPSSLTSLGVSSSSLCNVLNLSKLNNLYHLTLLDIHCANPDGIENLTKLKVLKLGVSNINCTIPFDLGSLIQLQDLSLFIQGKTCSGSLSSVSSTEFPLCKQEISFPPLSNLKKLTSVEFRNFLMPDGLENLQVRELMLLQYARIRNCSYQLIEVCLAKNLRRLMIDDCESLEMLPDLSHLKALISLHVRRSKKLQQIQGLESLESLERLIVGRCVSLQRLGNLSLLRRLSDINLFKCPELNCIEGIDTLFVERLKISNCRSIKNLEELKKRCRVGQFNGLRFENYH